jgi:hypothetical protein
MPYVPPHKRPGYVAPPPPPPPEEPTTGFRFRSPVRMNNTGTRHAPRAAQPTKSALRAVPKIASPENKVVPFEPTTDIKRMPPAFRAYIEAKLEEQRKEAARKRRAATKRRAAAQRAKETRRIKRRGHVKK